MTDKQIIKMLKEIVSSVDYDIYRATWVTPEEPEFAEEQIAELVAIVKKHIK